MTVVAEHISVPAQRRDIVWLMEALQAAIAIEHATLPLYLAAMFSLRIQNYTTYNAIRSVAMEEMGHMAIAANILAAIGGRPSIAGLDPRYPRRGLPGGAEPDLTVRLAKLSKRQLRSFMRIEAPAFLLAGLRSPERWGAAREPASQAGEEEAEQERYPTIASLYAAIGEAIDGKADVLRAAIRRGGAANQVGEDIGVKTVDASAREDPLSQIHGAIAEIVEQGEGSGTRTLHAGADSEEEESHYCKFAEIYYGRRYQPPVPEVELSNDTEREFFRGLKVPFPAVVNTLSVPADGYARILALDPHRTAVERALSAFDVAYTQIMSELEAVWNGPAERSWGTLGKSVTAMSGLRVLACFHIVTCEVPPGAVAALGELYPEEHRELAAYTDLAQPVFYGPRFINRNRPAAGAQER
jgi:Ferritin-like